jgi:hypothetical protein
MSYSSGERQLLRTWTACRPSTLAARRYLGEQAPATYLAGIDPPGTRMTRIALRPTWVAVIDFQTRLSGAFGGVTG